MLSLSLRVVVLLIRTSEQTVNVRCEIPVPPVCTRQFCFSSSPPPRAPAVTFVANTDRNPETNTCGIYTEVPGMGF